MKISSPVFLDNQKIPNKFSCDGENVNPPLAFSEIPQNSKSLVLIVDDPDAPNGDFTHWVVINIDPTVREIPQNSVPKGGMEGITSRGVAGWVSPCPPSGVHRYVFKLCALDSILNLSSNADKNAVEQAMEGHVIEKAEIIGLYSRPA